MLGRPTWLRVGALLLAMAATAVADDWPQWRGPNRDGTSAETGLMKSWPADGPTLARTIGGIGEGISSPMIADGRIYITGKVDGGIRLFCLGLDGARRWAAANGAARGRPSTARCSPTVDGDAVYWRRSRPIRGASGGAWTSCGSSAGGCPGTRTPNRC